MDELNPKKKKKWEREVERGHESEAEQGRDGRLSEAVRGWLTSKELVRDGLGGWEGLGLCEIGKDPGKKKKLEQGRESEAERGSEGGSWARPWRGGWLARNQCEMGEEDERAQGCARSARTKRRTMRESESWAWLLVAVWVRELRDEE